MRGMNVKLSPKMGPKTQSTFTNSDHIDIFESTKATNENSVEQQLHDNIIKDYTVTTAQQTQQLDTIRFLFEREKKQIVNKRACKLVAVRNLNRLGENDMH